MAVFILQTYNASGRLWARHFSASFCSSFNSSRIKTGERRIIRLDELNRFVRLDKTETIKVNLKRKLQYKSSALSLNIRPHKVVQAAQWLMNNSSLYKD